MGQIEVQDQVEGVQHLISERKYIDATRIGVSGWSYGGYLSLMCLAQRPDFFRVCHYIQLFVLVFDDIFSGCGLWCACHVVGGL